MLLLLAACAGPDGKHPTDRTPDDTATDTAGDTAPARTALPADCSAPGTLAADPLTLEGQARVPQDGSSPGFMEAVDVDLDGDRVYAVGQGGLLIFDVADPAAPARVYGPWEPGLGKLHRVEPLDTDHVVTTHRDRGLQVWDVSDPAAAEVVGEVEAGGMEGLVLVDGLLYVSVREEGVRVYDLSDPTAPALVGSGAGLEAPWELTTTGDGWLYAADATLGLVPIDVRDPTAPVVGTPVPLAGALHPRYATDRVWVATGGDGVAEYDVTDRASPRFVGTVETGGSAVMTDVADGRLWVVDHESVSVFDLSTTPPTPIQEEHTEQFALAVDAEGSRAFVGDWNLLDVYALADGAAPALDTPSDTVRLDAGTLTLTVTNRGGGTLTLAGATLEGMDVAVYTDHIEVPPGESATLTADVAGATTLCLASDDPDEPVRSFAVRDAAEAPAGVPAPDFALTDLDGETHRLSEQLGAPVLLAYFATW